ncbi:hypothetical protein HELRODRAFT_171348 [Helobdella robusta]|uniref:Uncharacterized protein n=1 Tax=Helobdella robusta TaxID=6412 RepID=T1F459_HELRO|nr:hypothetical protein HELRODRAFT_171348 [Helobdella robusta]ESO05688.1 hypothetical protein HELRODRAFT_171348 [Helobdella robusta]
MTSVLQPFKGNRVVGCEDFALPANTQFERKRNKMTIKCNSSRDTWYLTCRQNKWIGGISNCSEDKAWSNGFSWTNKPKLLPGNQLEGRYTRTDPIRTCLVGAVELESVCLSLRLPAQTIRPACENFDVSEIGSDLSDLCRQAGTCLYVQTRKTCQLLLLAILSVLTVAELKVIFKSNVKNKFLE